MKILIRNLCKQTYCFICVTLTLAKRLTMLQRFRDYYCEDIYKLKKRILIEKVLAFKKYPMNEPTMNNYLQEMEIQPFYLN